MTGPVDPVALQDLGPLQQALYARMVGDAELVGLLGAPRVYDNVPENVVRPYITLGEAIEFPDNTHDQFGSEVTETLHVWSDYRGFAEGLAIAARLRALFDHQPLDVDGLAVVAVRWELTQTLRDPDPAVRHVSVRFEISTEQES